MPSVPDEAPLCQKALRTLHRERERHEVLQGEASSRGVTEPDVRGIHSPRALEISYVERERKGGQVSTRQEETHSNFALNLIFV